MFNHVETSDLYIEKSYQFLSIHRKIYIYNVISTTIAYLNAPNV